MLKILYLNNIKIVLKITNKKYGEKRERGRGEEISKKTVKKENILYR